MKCHLKNLLVGFIISLWVASVAAAPASPALIPRPQQIKLESGNFQITAKTEIYASRDSQTAARQLAERLRRATGFPLKVHTKWWATHAIPNGIFLTTRSAPAELGGEGYEMSVAANSVTIHAPAQAGLFYGSQNIVATAPAGNLFVQLRASPKLAGALRPNSRLAAFSLARFDAGCQPAFL